MTIICVVNLMIPLMIPACSVLGRLRSATSKDEIENAEAHLSLLREAPAVTDQSSVYKLGLLLFVGSYAQ